MAGTDRAAVACFSLGANLGDRRATLGRALHALCDHPRIHMDLNRNVASLYASSPVGVNDNQPEYLNTAVRALTSLSARDLLAVALSIEAVLGRERRERWGPRTIDIDLLLYGGCVIEEPGLKVPHPRLAERGFVLEPLAEVAGGLTHPVLGMSIRALALRRSQEAGGEAMRRIAGPAWILDFGREVGIADTSGHREA